MAATKYIKLTDNHHLKYVPENDRYALYCGDQRVSGLGCEFISPSIVDKPKMTYNCHMCGKWIKNGKE